MVLVVLVVLVSASLIAGAVESTETIGGWPGGWWVLVTLSVLRWGAGL